MSADNWISLVDIAVFGALGIGTAVFGALTKRIASLERTVADHAKESRATSDDLRHHLDERIDGLRSDVTSLDRDLRDRLSRLEGSR